MLLIQLQNNLDTNSIFNLGFINFNIDLYQKAALRLLFVFTANLATAEKSGMIFFIFTIELN